MFKRIRDFLLRLICPHLGRQVESIDRDNLTWQPSTIYYCHACGKRWSSAGLPNDG